MKKALTIVGAVAALAATLSFVAAGSFKREQVTEADALPAYEILTTVRAMGDQSDQRAGAARTLLRPARL